MICTFLEKAYASLYDDDIELLVNLELDIEKISLARYKFKSESQVYFST